MSDCDQCGVRFNLLRRRKLCGFCGLVFCGDCLKRIGLGFNGSRRCNKCLVLTQWPLDVGEVTTLRVKDLRQFLHSRHINTATCTEKRDLIDLVTRHISSQHRGSSVGSQPSARQPPFSRPQAQTQPKPQQQQPSTYSATRDDGIRVRPTSTDTGSIRVRPVDSIRVRPGRPASPQDTPDYDPDEDLGIRVFASDGRGTREQESNVNRDHDNQLTRDQDSTHITRGSNDQPTSCCNLDSCLNTQSPTTPTNGVDNIGFESFDAQSGSTDTTNSQSHASEEVKGRAEEATGGADSQNQSSSSSQWGNEFQNASTNNGQWGSGSQNESTSAAPSAPPVLVLEDEEEDLASASSSASSSTPPSAASSPEPVKVVGEQGILSQIVALGDLKTEDDIRGLSVRQCKELLALHRVTYAGVREKSELLAKITILWKDYQHTKKEMESLPEELVCKICMDSAIDCVLLECGHMVACTPCGKQMSECPVCRQYVVRVVRTFRA